MALSKIQSESVNLSDNFAFTGTVTGAGSNIIEQLFLNGNGDSVTVPSGTYSLSNITVKQALTESYADITGSNISYTPPAGATIVVYEFNFRVYGAYPSVITHFKMYIDSDEVTQTRKTYGGGGSYDGEHVNFRWAIAIGGSANTASGRVASWTSAKTIKLMGRNYANVSYGANVHENVYWDGAALAQVVVPTMQITAYK
jgi:hypothetical protein